MENDTILDNGDLPRAPYQDTTSKVGDTGLGCLYGIIIIGLFGSIISSVRGDIPVIIGIGLILYAIAVIIAFRKKKKFLGIGLIIALVGPLIIFGGCLYLIDLKI